MLQISVNEKTQQIEGTYNGNDVRKGWIAVDEFPTAEYKVGFYAIPYFRNGKIEYEYRELPMFEKTHEMEMAEYRRNIIQRVRMRYSVDDEIAILRQRDSKPKEFEEYNSYVESIKKELKPHEGNI